MTDRDNLLVSIIIDNYNASSFIQEAIDSALNQTYANLEVIVVDDASTDGSHKIINSYGDRIIPIVKSENEGQLSAYNTGFCHSHGDIVCILDSDDIFYPNKVEEIVNIFQNERDPDELLIYHELQCIDRQGHNLGAKVPESIIHQAPTNTYQKACDRKFKFADYSFAASSGISFSRQLARSIFPLPGNKNVKARADSFVYTLAGLIGKVYGVNKTLGAFRIHGNNYHQQHKKPSMEQLTFVIALEKFLNEKLKEQNKKPTINLFHTIYYLYDYFYQNKSINKLMSLSLKLLQWHFNLRSIKLFIKTFSIYLP